MPGTIQISVLDIIDLPSPPSSMSIKVSMGKKEYLGARSGDLWIPLTTLRENLIVKLVDDSGNEVSRAVVQTRSIIEKGIWDDRFPLEGGGKIHLKMHFFLSEEEQSKIRIMRLSALQKKHVEKSFVPSSLPHPSISRSSSLLEVASILDAKPSFPVKAEQHSSKVVEKTEMKHPRQIKDIDRDGEKASSLPENEPTTDAKNSVSSPNTELRLERTPSDVRKMISVFETSLAQAQRPRVKPPPLKAKSSVFPQDSDVVSVSIKSLVKSEIESEFYEANEDGRSGREWIFLEEPSRYCATLVGNQPITEVEPKSSSEVDDASQHQQNRGKSTKTDSSMPNGGEKNFSCKENTHNSDGPLGQLVKVAVMVGFGALVLFTRQRKDR